MPAVIIVIISIVMIFILVGLFRCIRIVPQGYCWITEFLGKYKSTWNAGLHIKIPFVERVVNKVILKEQVLDFPPQNVITKDNVVMGIDSVVFLQIVDAKSYTYGISDAITAIGNLTATTLRNIIGNIDFDKSLASRDYINTQMTEILDKATDVWGIKITRVEIKNILPPKDIQEAMSKQMKAERDRRQTVLEAEAHKQSVIARAEGDRQAKVLAAEAERDAEIALANGRAEATRLAYLAEAEGIAALNNAKIDPSVLKLKGINALKDIADGNATKIFIPSDISDVLSTIGAANELIGEKNAMPTLKKPTPKPPVVNDPCLHENVSTITRNAAQTTTEINHDVEDNRG